LVLFTDAKSTAQSTAQLAEKLGRTGSLNKLDQAREQAFYAETTADLAALRQEATSSRERLVRLLGLWDGDIAIRLPQRLPALPGRPRSLPGIEVDAVAHRLDLQMARIELAALAKSLNLTQASRFVTLIGEFAARREIDAGELVAVPIDHPLFQGTHARVLVKSARPLVAAAQELLDWILRRMKMFAPQPALGRKLKRG